MGKKAKSRLTKSNLQKNNAKHLRSEMKKSNPSFEMKVRNVIKGKKSLELDTESKDVTVVDMLEEPSSNIGFMNQTDSENEYYDNREASDNDPLFINMNAKFVETCTDKVLTIRLSDTFSDRKEMRKVHSKSRIRKRKISQSMSMDVATANNALRNQRNVPLFKSVHQKNRYKQTIYKENYGDIERDETADKFVMSHDNSLELMDDGVSFSQNDVCPEVCDKSSYWNIDHTMSTELSNVKCTGIIDENMDDSTKNKKCLSIPFSEEEACLMIVEHPQELCIQGKCSITMVTGNMTIMGYRISAGESHKLYSPVSCSYTVLKTSDAVNDLKQLYNKMSDLIGNVATSRLDQFSGCHIVSFIVRPLDCPVHNYISSMAPYNGLFAIRTSAALQYNIDLLPLGIGLFPRACVKRPCMMLSKEMNKVIDVWGNRVSRSNISGPPVIITCGGKRGGKSTLNRHLINSALKLCKKVYFLELDVGQTEFTFPGCLSLHCVTEPLLGPPFTHIRKADRMCYYGGVTGGVDVQLYIKCVEYVFAAYNEDFPLIINTMGWTSGLGVNILVDILHITKPDLVVQVNMFRDIDNFPPLTHSFKEEHEGWLYNRKPVDSSTRHAGKEHVGHELLIVETSLPSTKEVSTFSSVDQRNLVLLSYFCDNLKPGETLLSITPYTIPWSSVAVHICHYADISQSQTLSVLNASIVGLCHSNKLQPDDHSNKLQPDNQNQNCPRLLKEFPMCHCLGFGLVRGIDVIKKLVYIVTPMCLADLERVNVLVKGTIALPDQIVKQQKTKIVKPYIDTMARSAGSWNMNFHEQRLRRSAIKYPPDVAHE